MLSENDECRFPNVQGQEAVGVAEWLEEKEKGHDEEKGLEAR